VWKVPGAIQLERIKQAKNSNKECWNGLRRTHRAFGLFVSQRPAT